MNAGNARAVVLTLLISMIALAGCGTVPAHTAAGPAAAGPATGTVLAGQGYVGQAGWGAWRVTSLGLSVSTDGGRHFAQVPLPAKVGPAAVLAVTQASGGTAWLCAAGPGRSVTVYARNSQTGSWSAGTRLTPRWPAGLGGAELMPPTQVAVTAGRAGQVVVTTQLMLSHSVAIMRMFVSADGGKTFAQRILPSSSALNTPWWSAVMSGTYGVAVIGNRMNEVVHTVNGGSSWSASALSGVSGDYVAGPAIFAGSTTYLPVTESDHAGHGKFVLLRSTDGGATFSAGGDQAVSFGGPFDPSPAPLSAEGSVWWLVYSPGGVVYRSADYGRSWSKAPALLPPGVISIGAAGARNATATIQKGTCATGKTNCTSLEFLETTADGGRSWTRL
ncbi:MAG TPA: sialidase family protein [Streptosporangiaceae bacterium]